MSQAKVSLIDIAVRCEVGRVEEKQEGSLKTRGSRSYKLACSSGHSGQ